MGGEKERKIWSDGDGAVRGKKPGVAVSFCRDKEASWGRVRTQTNEFIKGEESSGIWDRCQRWLCLWRGGGEGVFFREGRK